ncbi:MULTISPECIES: DUF4365 domain-containing protein [unclassified Xanthomonas]|uniref:DUF4365 domain-containing protein n=1 Tax=unclassified Xanthomonas TaxID=2643310 RepID=UPI00065ADD4F|nr:MULTISPECIES: DUF4365 domain-containing protein [unclassified Xanthomonas]KMM75572.1 hypothetical protein ACP93_10755 [Xanthomonas sp. NCPPB 1128]MXV05786.1 DUF4365 domain-containing protein [Xanthomonas sp. LMG 9002]
MRYTEQQIIGDLGELAVARAFIRYFRWPCRRQTVDLGVDAEVEITDDDLNATGKIVKVQVKASMSPFVDGKNTVYLETRHVDYWKDFSVPVLLCAVSVATDEVLWKVIASDRDYATGQGGAKVEFDRVADALSPASRHAIERIAVEGGDMIMQILGIAETSIVTMLDNAGNPSLSLDNTAQVERHELNRSILSMAYELLRLTGRRPRAGANARLASLQRLWNAIDLELDRQNKDQFY